MHKLAVSEVLILASAFFSILFVASMWNKSKKGKFYVFSVFWLPSYTILTFQSLISEFVFVKLTESALIAVGASVWLSSSLLYFSLYREGEVTSLIPLASLFISLLFFISFLLSI